jgi:hypothetical protein
MKICENLERCLYFKQIHSGTAAFAEELKNMYCCGNQNNCARYMVFKELGQEYIDNSLAPYMSHKANEIIENNMNHQ